MGILLFMLMFVLCSTFFVFVVGMFSVCFCCYFDYLDRIDGLKKKGKKNDYLVGNYGGNVCYVFGNNGI